VTESHLDFHGRGKPNCVVGTASFLDLLGRDVRSDTDVSVTADMVYKVCNG